MENYDRLREYEERLRTLERELQEKRVESICREERDRVRKEYEQMEAMRRQEEELARLRDLRAEQYRRQEAAPRYDDYDYEPPRRSGDSDRLRYLEEELRRKEEENRRLEERFRARYSAPREVVRYGPTPPEYAPQPAPQTVVQVHQQPAAVQQPAPSAPPQYAPQPQYADRKSVV